MAAAREREREREKEKREIEKDGVFEKKKDERRKN